MAFLSSLLRLSSSSKRSSSSSRPSSSTTSTSPTSTTSTTLTISTVDAFAHPDLAIPCEVQCVVLNLIALNQELKQQKKTKKTISPGAIAGFIARLAASHATNLSIAAGPTSAAGWTDELYSQLAHALASSSALLPIHHVVLDGYQDHRELLSACFTSNQVRHVEATLQMDSPLHQHLDLLSSSSSCTVQTLTLSVCNPAHAQALFHHLSLSSSSSSLSRLDLHYSDLRDDATVAALCQALTSCSSTIRSLDLRHCRLSPHAVQHLIARTLPLCPSLHELALSGNARGVGCAGAAALAACSFGHVRVLRISQCGIGGDGLVAIGAALATSQLTKLDVSYNKDITDAYLAEFARRYLPHSRLTALELYGSNCTQQGIADALAPALRNPACLLLEVNKNFVPDELKSALRLLMAKESLICLLSARGVRRFAKPHKTSCCPVRHLPVELVRLVGMML